MTQRYPFPQLFFWRKESKHSLAIPKTAGAFCSTPELPRNPFRFGILHPSHSRVWSSMCWYSRRGSLQRTSPPGREVQVLYFLTHWPGVPHVNNIQPIWSEIIQLDLANESRNMNSWTKKWIKFETFFGVPLTLPWELCGLHHPMLWLQCCPFQPCLGIRIVLVWSESECNPVSACPFPP